MGKVSLRVAEPVRREEGQAPEEGETANTGGAAEGRHRELEGPQRQ